MLSRSATVNISITLLIILIIAGVVFVVLLLAGSGIINLGFSFFKSTTNSTQNGGGGVNVISSNKVEFIAYNCTGLPTYPCNKFSPGIYFWYVDYNGLNLSTNASEPINFTEVQGTYLFHPYNITYNDKTYFVYNSSENIPTGRIYYVYYEAYNIVTAFNESGLPSRTLCENIGPTYWPWNWSVTYDKITLKANLGTEINFTTQPGTYKARIYGNCFCNSEFYLPISGSPVNGTGGGAGNLNITLTTGYHGQPEVIQWKNTGPC